MKILMNHKNLPLLFLVTTLFLINSAYGETDDNLFQLNGQVIDETSKKGLPYTHVIYYKKHLGTITNNLGYFNLTINNSHLTDTITISYLGYKTRQLTVEECIQNKILQLEPSLNKIEEVVVEYEELRIYDFMKEVIRQYNKDKIKDSHIAITHFREKAKKDDKYIMYFESIGYSIFIANSRKQSEYSDYPFYCDYSKAMIIHPQWLAYNKHACVDSPIPVGAFANLDLFRHIELDGLLSEKQFKKYKFSLIETIDTNNQKVYCIGFRGRGDKGIIQVYKNSKTIARIEIKTNDYYSWAVDKRIKSTIQIEIDYYNGSPFISAINSRVNRHGLEYYNDIKIITQKFGSISISGAESMQIQQYAVCPVIEYRPEIFQNYKIANDSDFFKIEQDLSSEETSLEQQFINASGKGTCPEWVNMDAAIKKIDLLKDNF